MDIPILGNNSDERNIQKLSGRGQSIEEAREYPGFLSSLDVGSKSIDIQTEIFVYPEPCIMVTAYFGGRVLLSKKEPYQPGMVEAREMAGKCHTDMETNIRTRLKMHKVDEWKKKVSRKTGKITKHKAPFRPDLTGLDEVEGIIGACLVNRVEGTILGKYQGNQFELGMLARGCIRVINTELDLLKSAGLDETIEDIVINLDTQYHIIRQLASADHLILFSVVDRKKTNLALARHELRVYEIDLIGQVTAWYTN